MLDIKKLCIEAKREVLSHPVTELPLREPLTLGADATVRDAIKAMRDARVGCVFVVNHDGEPLGKFTEFMLVRLLVREPAALDDPIVQHMSTGWCGVKKDAPIADVIDAMQRRHVRFVCVLDDDGRVMALTGQRGVMEYLAERFSDVVRPQYATDFDHLAYAQREGA